MASPGSARLKRSYERNLGYCRFWAGAGTILLAGLLLFIANTLWEIGANPKIGTPLSAYTFAIGAVVLAHATVVSSALAWMFRNWYRRDDTALTQIEQAGQDAAP